MNLVLQSLRSFPVTIGELTLYLSEYQISETATLKESGTAGGGLVLSGCWPKGSRISLKGKLSPSLSPQTVIYTLSQALLTEQILLIQNLKFQNAMLCDYTVTENQDTPEIALLFFSAQKPLLILESGEEESA